MFLPKKHVINTENNVKKLILFQHLKPFKMMLSSDIIYDLNKPLRNKLDSFSNSGAEPFKQGF